LALPTSGSDPLVTAAGIAALLAPGHTPGHLCVVISSGERRALLLGDAITGPIQLDEPAWHSMGDVDPRSGRPDQGTHVARTER
jgi:glyoxylase-like metal-dependent hydrolase (beta-lactamase superfamily II)